MDRRLFLSALGTCGVLALPLGCGPKKEKEGDEPAKDADAPGPMLQPPEDEEKGDSDAPGETPQPDQGGGN